MAGERRTDAIPIAAWLEEEGFADDAARRAARRVLETAGLTNPRKQAISTAKLEHARAVLAAEMARVCGPACRRLAASLLPGRPAVASTTAHCDVCLGSNNRRAALGMAAAFRERGLSRLLVLGGSAGTLRELQGLLAGTGIELRTVAGSEHLPNKKGALADLGWAQVMAVWASTPLPHKVSVSYTDERPRELPFVTVSRRGVEALCQELTRLVSD